MRRAGSPPFVATLAGLLAALVLGIGVAAAKFPYFSVELDPASPRPDEPVTVIVRLWDDEAHTQPVTWWPANEPIEGLIEFRGEGGRVPVTLTQAGVAEYRAEVVLPEGDWTLFSFPLGGGALDAPPSGYPPPLAVTVAPATVSPTVIGAVAIGLLGLAALVLFGMRTRHRARAHAIRRSAGEAFAAPQVQTSKPGG
jgi:hypothetical protein